MIKLTTTERRMVAALLKLATNRIDLDGYHDQKLENTPGNHQLVINAQKHALVNDNFDQDENPNEVIVVDGMIHTNIGLVADYITDKYMSVEEITEDELPDIE